MGIVIVAVVAVIILFQIYRISENKERERMEAEYRQLRNQAWETMGISSWDIISEIDESVVVKSRQSLEKYDEVKFFKDNKEKLTDAEIILQQKQRISELFRTFLDENNYKTHPQYSRLVGPINKIVRDASAYRIEVNYISSAGNHLGSKVIEITQQDLYRFREDPSLLMTRGEYNKLLKEQEKDAISQKQHEFYERVNYIIDFANHGRTVMTVKGSQDKLDALIAQLFDRTVNNIKKIKTINSEEWEIIGEFISQIQSKVEEIVNYNQKILAYYDSLDFQKIKEASEVLMSTQREFNQYINEKVQSISQLFGTRVVRSETVNNDEYNYIRPYRKTITPFTAEVSATVFASAENNPLEYIVKNFYPNKRAYPEQIRKLYRLVEELETLKEAKQIIENYKTEYQQYLVNVPNYIMENDEAGFYSRLGFATIDESILSVEYKFVYTSNGGMAQRSFAVPMTEETIAELIKVLESKLTASAFAKEQRTLMTKKLRNHIKTRDNFTCCMCGNSTHAEPNLLLEIDHIVPVSKGGCTTEENLQTLCWKCNRAKSNKILD